MLAGCVLIVRMPLELSIRGLAFAAWLAASGIQIRRLLAGGREVAKIRVDNAGGVWVSNFRGRWQAVDILPGTMVLRRLAWLRIRLADGRKYGELLAGNAVKDVEWQRFQLLWQQCRQRLAGVDPC